MVESFIHYFQKLRQATLMIRNLGHVYKKKKKILNKLYFGDNILY